MSKTYIAGFDGSPESRAAVDLAVRLARTEVGKVVAAHVYPYAAAAYWITVEAMRYDEIEDDYLHDAEGLLAELELEGIEKRAVKSDSPARGLHELAEELDAKLIAVGVTARGPLGRLAPGSVATHLLHGAPCQVLVVPAGVSDSPMRTIGVAYDGREESQVALHTAREMAERLGARLVVIGARQPVRIPVPPMAPGMPDLVEEDRQQFETMLTRGAETVDGEYRMLMGDPGREIADASADVDLLVTGSRGYGAVGSVLLGSVSRHLVDHAQCPVLVVPRRV